MAKGCIGLEIERRSTDPARSRPPPATVLRGDIEGDDLEKYVEEQFVTTTFEKMLNLARSNSIFPLTFGLACCAIEAPISIVTARYDLARFGAEALRASPRQADLIILSGRVSIKMAPVVRRLYDQMLEPKWAISMGACSSSGGMFANYAVVQGAEKFMPIDLHSPAARRGPRPSCTASPSCSGRSRQPDQGWRQPTTRRPRGVGPRRAALGTERRGRRGLRAARELPLPDAVDSSCCAAKSSATTPARCSTSFDRDQRGADRRPRAGARVLTWLRDSPGQAYRFLSSLHVADYLPNEPRFGVHYELLNRDRRERLRVKAMLADPARKRCREIDSCVDLFPTAHFQERESYDFFGSSSAATRT